MPTAGVGAPQPSSTVLATPEDISDHVHVLSAKVSGVSLTYTVTYVSLSLFFIYHP